MRTFIQLQNEIIVNKKNMEYINWMLNEAIRNQTIISKDYQHLCSIAKAFGFRFGEYFNLI